MILQDKAKEDFRKWVKENDYPVSLWALEDGLIDKAVEYALIIEWLDSVGIYIDTHHSYSFDAVLEYCAKVSGVYVSHGIKDKPINRFDSRQEATKAAIEKANEIYNTRHSAQ